jgi:hypothetical protein
MVYVVIGVTVVVRWGWDIDDPFTLLEAWPAESAAGEHLHYCYYYYYYYYYY